MSRLARLGIGAACLVLMSLLPAAVAAAHEGNPNFESTVRAVRPDGEGIRAEILNYDDRMLFINRSGKTLLVRGYDGEPYVRIDADGEVAVNKHSPSFYLNEDRFAKVEVPPEATAKAKPLWDTVGADGRHEWHDHRVHWMSKELPAKVTDKSERTKVFDWRVPFELNGRKGAVLGDLYWDQESSSIPRGAVLALAALLFGGIAFIEVVRRRRRQAGRGRKGDDW